MAYYGGDQDDNQFNNTNTVQYGGDGNDQLGKDDDNFTAYGGDGNDALFQKGLFYMNAFGGNGNDWLQVEGNISADSYLYGDEGNDYIRVIGGTASNYIDGGRGTDALYGGGGSDTIYGGDGDDLSLEITAGSGNVGFTATVAGGLYGGAGDDYLDGGRGDDTLYGEDGSDTLIGGSGIDLLNGGSGSDLMEGGSGGDVYVVDNGGDRVVEAVGGGSDIILTKISYKLADGQEIEELEAYDSASTGKMTLVGNAFAQSITGNAGANTLDGGAGADTLIGLQGNDLYRVDNGGDRVIEGAGGGQDTVLTAISHALTAGQEIEILATQNDAGTASLNLFGNSFANTIRGNAGKNLINGKDGADVLTGGAGADTFVFDTALAATNVDRITDFSVVDDTIRLSKAVFTELAAGPLTASAFKDIGLAGRDADDRILYDSRNGKLFYDADGSGRGAAVQFAVLDNKAAITHADFLIG